MRFEKFDAMCQKAGLSLEYKEDTDKGTLGIWDGYCRHPNVTFRKFGGPEEQSFVTVWSLIRDNEPHSFSGVQYHEFVEGLRKTQNGRVEEVMGRALEGIETMERGLG